MKTIAIIQSSYIPWKGYFDIINDVDTFVFLEDVQYTIRDWRNRNKIKTPDGISWISVPVKKKTNQKIFEAKINYSEDWINNHKKSIHHSYASSEYYYSFVDDIFSIFTKKFDTISELNIFAVKKISDLLGISPCFINSLDIQTQGTKDDKLINICRELNADIYLSGPSAKAYIDESKFKKNNIELRYKSYEGYPEYPQLWNNFEHFVSIIDLIFNCGEKASYYIWEWRK